MPNPFDDPVILDYLRGMWARAEKAAADDWFADYPNNRWVCDRWNWWLLGGDWSAIYTAAANLLEDMGVRPDGYILWRRDANSPYSPENSYWREVVIAEWRATYDAWVAIDPALLADSVRWQVGNAGFTNFLVDMGERPAAGSLRVYFNDYRLGFDNCYWLVPSPFYWTPPAEKVVTTGPGYWDIEVTGPGHGPGYWGS